MLAKTTGLQVLLIALSLAASSAMAQPKPAPKPVTVGKPSKATTQEAPLPTSRPLAQQSQVQLANPIIYDGGTFQLMLDRVVQDASVARALNARQLESNYQSPATGQKDPRVPFKFSINGRDNEMPPGVDHIVYCLPAKEGDAITPPVITFGKHYKQETTVPAGASLPPNTPVKLRLDMRPVLQSLKEKGHYVLYNGDKVFAADFKGVWVAGGSAPLTWDFDNLATRQQFQLKDPDGDGIYEITLMMNGDADRKLLAPNWSMERDATAHAQYSSGWVLHDALYNLALEEMLRAVEPDGTFRTGKEWAGVWTRDISYSIILSMASQLPEVAKTSLRRKVKNKRIIQDTGTGGAYPVSSDRMIWAVAAWEIYLSTGDEAWLAEATEVVRNSVNDDLANLRDASTGLMKGESSFLDWREQTYPRWMEPADIFESLSLGTNAVHYQTLQVLASMERIQNRKQDAARYASLAAQLKAAINKHLWLPEKGYYAQFMYGRAKKMVSPRAEALGEAMCILFGIADEAQAARMMESVPLLDFGIPCIYPQIPGIPPYHNDGIWPFVQSYWALAAAKSKHEGAFMHGLATVMRPAALFLTNKENFVAGTGDYAGTQVNSSVMLWSLSGAQSLVHKGLFGIRYEEDGLRFEPMVPKVIAGSRSLTNFKFRKAILDIELRGYGAKVTSMTLDGEPQGQPFISGVLQGKHKVVITLAEDIAPTKINLVKNAFSPETPKVKLGNADVNGNSIISWEPVAEASSYIIFRDGKRLGEVKTTQFVVPRKPGYSEVQVVAKASSGLEGFASEPVLVAGPTSRQSIPCYTSGITWNKPANGARQPQVLHLTRTQNNRVILKVNIKEAGKYALYFRYANGNGPVNTENKCAIRTLRLDGDSLGTVVFPQRGNAEWSNWGFSNKIVTKLKPGLYNLSLNLDLPANENMHGDINEALLDELWVDQMSE